MIMATNKITLEDPMMCIKFGWGNTIILPWVDGVRFLDTMKLAQFVKSEYKDGGVQWFVNTKPEFSMEVFTPAMQANLLMNGTGGES